MKHRCNFTRLEPIEKVIPNPRNPNTHPEGQIDILAKIMEFQGWRLPIVVSKRSGFIVRGHGRLLAAQRLGLKKVPIDEQDYENEAQEWADLIADNRIAELAETDRATLKDVLEELDTGELDLDLTGFGQDSLENLMSQVFQGSGENDPNTEWVGMPAFEQDDLTAKYTVRVHFDSVDDLKDFSKKIKQKFPLSKTLTSIWHPMKERLDLKSLECADES